MTSKTTINRIIGAALLLIALYLILSVTRVFRGQSGWMEYAVMAAVCVLAFFAGFLRLRRRAEMRHSAKASRDSLQKHMWELKHKREW